MRREQRVATNLPVLLSGIDLNGNRFKQNAHVVNVSRSGACLDGIRCLRTPRDFVEVKFRGRKARYRVVWIYQPAGQAGICCIEPHSYIWGVPLPPPILNHLEPLRPPTSEVPSTSANVQSDLLPAPSDPSLQHGVQRRYRRYRCRGGASINAPTLERPIWGSVTVISLGGCFIETMSPVRPQTHVELLLRMHDILLGATAVVCSSLPRIGVGLMFTDTAAEDRQQLNRIIAGLTRYEVKNTGSFC